MKAVLLHAFGNTDGFRYEEIPTPEPAKNEVLIRVAAAGINPVDTKIRSGKFARFLPALPAVIGRDVCGVIESVGTTVVAFKLGDRVFGMLDYDRGAYAEYAIASPREIAKTPASLEPGRGAALPVAALTAWQALFDYGRLEPGQRVLIHGANGGVGHLAVQLAAWRGAEVLGTCHREDVDFVKSLGAVEVIDYKAERFEEKVREVDLVLDLIAGETRERSWQTLKAGGILVSTLPSPVPRNRTDVSGREVVVSANSDQLERIAALMAIGALDVVIHRTHPLAEAAEAHRQIEEQHGRGKTVLTL